MNWFDINEAEIKDRNFVAWKDVNGVVQMENTISGVLAEYIELKRLQQDLAEHSELINDAD